MLALWIVLGVLVLLAIVGVVAYNRFVSQKQLIKDSWANIDTELRRRYDLIPNLVETVRGYAGHVGTQPRVDRVETSAGRTVSEGCACAIPT